MTHFKTFAFATAALLAAFLTNRPTAQGATPEIVAAWHGTLAGLRFPGFEPVTGMLVPITGE